jgi:hypothetical protein
LPVNKSIGEAKDLNIMTFSKTHIQIIIVKHNKPLMSIFLFFSFLLPYASLKSILEQGFLSATSLNRAYKALFLSGASLPVKVKNLN